MGGEQKAINTLGALGRRFDKKGKGGKRQKNNKLAPIKARKEQKRQPPNDTSIRRKRITKPKKKPKRGT